MFLLCQNTTLAVIALAPCDNIGVLAAYSQLPKGYGQVSPIPKARGRVGQGKWNRTVLSPLDTCARGCGAVGFWEACVFMEELQQFWASLSCTPATILLVFLPLPRAYGDGMEPVVAIVPPHHSMCCPHCCVHVGS